MITATIALLVAFSQDQEMSPAGRFVYEWMSRNIEHGSSMPVPEDVGNASLSDLVKATFHSVHYREFPLQEVPPKPMATRNLFSVKTDGTVSHFKLRKSFAKAFVSMARPIRKGNLKSLAMGYAQASTVFSQDGMFQFVFHESKITSRTDGDRMFVTVVAPVVERAGDTGSLTATLEFKDEPRVDTYRLVSVTEKDTIKPGVRPVCQCTLLLDANPRVRLMAERDLLIMGRSAESYIREQRALASPELRVEIDRVWRRILNGER